MDDLISRQAAIDAIADYLSNTTYTSAISFLNTGALILARLPTAEKKGKWIDHEVLGYLECSECHMEWSRITNRVEFFRYCPNCGARMEENE